MNQPPLEQGPGLYTKGVSGGPRIIGGVGTSVTAFVGRFANGPLGTPITVLDYADAVSIFGGIVADSPVTYALRDFFDNGGSQALVVRQYRAPSSKPSAGARPAAVAPGTGWACVGGVVFVGSSPGVWGNNLQVTVAQSDPNAAAAYAPLGLLPADLFDLTIRYWPTPSQSASYLTETIPCVTVKPGARRIDLVLEQRSQFLRLAYDTFPTALSAGATDTPSAVASAEAALLGTPAQSTSNVFVDGADSDPLQYADYTDDTKGYKAVLGQGGVFNILVLPPDNFTQYVDTRLLSDAASFCQSNLAFYIVEPFANPAPDDGSITPWTELAARGNISAIDISSLGVTELASAFAAIYFPPATFPGRPSPYPLSGILAGIYATTDADRGVWKAPAGLSAIIPGASGLTVSLNGSDRDFLDAQGINVFRDIPNVGTVVWGDRTMNGADILGSDYKYIPVRRLANYIAASVSNGIQWAVFEPNDETLWASLRQVTITFMTDLFNQGAFAGNTPQDAWFVHVDATTTTPVDQAAGIVNVVVGFSPIQPARFLVLYVQQATALPS